MQKAENTGKVKRGAGRKRLQGLAIAVLSVLLLLSAGCGQKSGAEASSESAEVMTETAGTGETTGAGDAAAAEESGGAPEAEESSGAGETEEAPPALVVTKHKEDGTHMVTAGAMTISVPPSTIDTGSIILWSPPISILLT